MKWHKLVDVDQSDTRRQRALELFLDRHDIKFVRNTFGLHGRTRFLVKPSDLCAAQSVLQAIEGLEDEPEPPRAA